MIELPSPEEIERAAETLAPHLLPTPLLPFRDGGVEPGILLKPESLQRASSFKIRGVFHAVSRLSPAARSRGVSTVSAGNTAQALAWSARHFDVPARSLMPTTAPKTKIDAVRAYGAEPVLLPPDELFRFLRERGWQEEPYAFIHPWIERNVMIGHATIGKELCEAPEEFDSVFVPVGGGGLIAGIASAIRHYRSGVRIVAVEPAGCPALHTSLERGCPSQVNCKTLCDGVAVPYITEEMYPLLARLVDEVRLVSESEVVETIRSLALENGLIAEPSAALSLAAARKMKHAERGQSVCIVTGRSIDRERLAEILG